MLLSMKQFVIVGVSSRKESPENGPLPVVAWGSVHNVCLRGKFG